jgi:hypothetical protein
MEGDVLRMSAHSVLETNASELRRYGVVGREIMLRKLMALGDGDPSIQAQAGLWLIGQYNVQNVRRILFTPGLSPKSSNQLSAILSESYRSRQSPKEMRSDFVRAATRSRCLSHSTYSIATIETRRPSRKKSGRAGSLNYASLGDG